MKHLSTCLALPLLLLAGPDAVQAQPYAGTIFIDPDIISESDPGTLTSVTYTGQGMKTVWDYRVNQWTDINAYLYDVVWNDGLTSLGVVNPEFGSPAAGQTEVETYADALGKVPYCLRTGVNELWIHAGVASFGGGNNAIVIHTGRGQEYIADGILEEAFVHEGTHCSLDALYASDPDWQAAQNADPDFISTYAAGAPTTEDLAETYLPWLAVRVRSSRISTTDYNTILATIPQRLTFLDGITCDLNPVTPDVGIAAHEPQALHVSVFPSPAHDRFTVQPSASLPTNTTFELLSADGRVLRSARMNGPLSIDVSGVAAGLYVWRCTADGEAIQSGRVVIDR